MEIRKIAHGWLKNAIDKIPPGEWILIADGRRDYYDWHIAQGSVEGVKKAYEESGGVVARIYRVMGGVPEKVWLVNVICSKCKVGSKMSGGVCPFCGEVK